MDSQRLQHYDNHEFDDGETMMITSCKLQNTNNNIGIQQKYFDDVENHLKRNSFNETNETFQEDTIDDIRQFAKINYCYVPDDTSYNNSNLYNEENSSDDKYDYSTLTTSESEDIDDANNNTSDDEQNVIPDLSDIFGNAINTTNTIHDDTNNKNIDNKINVQYDNDYRYVDFQSYEDYSDYKNNNQPHIKEACKNYVNNFNMSSYLEKILTNSLESRNEKLMLIGDTINVIPDILKEFTWVTDLTIKNTKIQKLINLPPCLTSLTIESNLIPLFDGSLLPDTVVNLKMTSNKTLNVINLKEGIVNLNLSYGYFNGIMSKIPSSVQTLIISENKNLSTLPKFSDDGVNIRTIDISRTSILDISELPNGITELQTNHCLFENVNKLPRDLIVWKSYKSKIKTINCDFPKNLTEVDLSYCFLNTCPDFGNDIKLIDLSSNCLQSLPKFPDTVSSVDFRNNYLISEDELTELQQRLPGNVSFLFGDLNTDSPNNTYNNNVFCANFWDTTNDTHTPNTNVNSNVNSNIGAYNKPIITNYNYSNNANESPYHHDQFSNYYKKNTNVFHNNYTDENTEYMRERNSRYMHNSENFEYIRERNMRYDVDQTRMNHNNNFENMHGRFARNYSHLLNRHDFQINNDYMEESFDYSEKNPHYIILPQRAIKL